MVDRLILEYEQTYHIHRPPQFVNFPGLPLLLLHPILSLKPVLALALEAWTLLARSFLTFSYNSNPSLTSFSQIELNPSLKI
jgi:hypothetical protein